MSSSEGHPQSFPSHGGFHRTQLLLPSIPLYRAASSERPRDVPMVIQNGRVRIRTFSHRPRPHSEIKIKNLYCWELQKLKKCQWPGDNLLRQPLGLGAFRGQHPPAGGPPWGMLGKAGTLQLPTSHPFLETSIPALRAQPLLSRSLK